MQDGAGGPVQALLQPAEALFVSVWSGRRGGDLHLRPRSCPHTGQSKVCSPHIRILIEFLKYILYQ